MRQREAGRAGGVVVVVVVVVVSCRVVTTGSNMSGAVQAIR